MNEPSVHIVLMLENPRPLVYVDAVNEGEQLRIDDWVRAHPRLLELVERASELAREERAA